MPAQSPHYLLFSEGSSSSGERATDSCSWRFVLEPVDGGNRIVAEDAEPEAEASRAELLAVVRGLEALDGPARVTLVTRSNYVARGIRRGLGEWRRHNWRWERFGRWVPVRDHDLWQRVDRALGFHQVNCRVWRFDQEHATDDTDLASNSPNWCANAATSRSRCAERSRIPAPKANFSGAKKRRKSTPVPARQPRSADRNQTVHDQCMGTFGKIMQFLGWNGQQNWAAAS